MINTIERQGAKNEKSGFCSLLLGESAAGCFLGAREERKERDNKKRKDAQRVRNMKE